MPLSTGDKLGPYEVLSAIGAGGMGEVFKARDTRLERMVAIKTSNEKFSERFQREAQAIASLNHPHICTLYDVGPDYLVLELIEGQPLKGPMPVAEAMKLAIQIAEAMNEAHRHGVIHRDLKPANIMVTKAGVKILDFGLAKLSTPASGAHSGETLAAAMTQRMLTQDGVILGTPQYMAPEQLEGKEADARTDIFAFGLVLYEMLCGQPAFSGKTQANLIASILAAEPVSVSSFQPLVPPALEHLIRNCLAKDPDERQQNMHDVLLGLRWAAQSGSQAGMPKPVVARRKHREWLAWSLAGAALAAVGFLGFTRSAATPAPRAAVQFQFSLPDKVRMEFYDLPAVSPDGRSIVVAAAEGAGVRRAWLRRMDTGAVAPVPGTEGARPFIVWSPDSRSILFSAERRLKRQDLGGGAAMELAETDAAGTLPTWGEDGTVMFSRGGVLYRVSASGGKEETVLPPELSPPGARQAGPHLLPGGRYLLYGVQSASPAQAGTFLADLERKKSVRVFATPTNAQSAPPGYLLFGRQRSLAAQQFDAKTGQLSGEAVVIAAGVRESITIPGLNYFSVSQTGTVAYRGATAFEEQSFTYYDRSGARLGTVGPPRRYVQFQVAPDGRRLSVMAIGDADGKLANWEMNLGNGILSLLAPPTSMTDLAVWSPDSTEIIYPAADSGPRQLYRKPAGSEQPTLVLPSKTACYAEQWLKDNSLLYLDEGGRNFYRLRLEPGAKPEPLLHTEYAKDEPEVSPDGRWIVYTANQTGRWEIYLAAFPAFDRRRQISSNGGVQPKWSKDGKEIFYLSLDGALMGVPITDPATSETAAPKALFRPKIAVYPTRDQYAVIGNGQRFLFLESLESGAEPIHVIVNWESLLGRK